jgi:hypothetical protein
MRLKIYSHFEGDVWEGDVPELDSIEEYDEVERDSVVNEHIFRLFNRVDEGDNERLEAWGYRLPSLSVGDVIEYDGRAWKVDDFGFQGIPTP